jgi:HEAT repeat protein
MQPRFWILAVAAMLFSGCNSQPTPRKLTREPEPPPKYPARQDVPIDQAARVAATREIETALKSSDPVMRANAVEAVQDCFGAEQGRDHILAALNDPDPLVRFAASMAAGTLRIRDAKPRLLALADDKDPSVRIGVRFALHRLGDTHLSHDLETLAGDPDPRVRGNAALALGLLGEPSALGILKGMTKDRSPLVRFQVAEARWRLHDIGGAQDLIAGTVSGFPDDQMFCVLALAGPRDARALQHIRGKLTGDYQEICLIAARAAGMLGSDAGYGVAVNGAHSPDPRQRVLAAMAFGDIGRTDAQPILIKLLQDDEKTVRLAAATALLELKAA